MKLLGAQRAVQQKQVLKLFSPTPAQRRVLESKHQFNVVRFGRQAGKSTFGNNRLLDKAWRRVSARPDMIPNYWYLGPTYRLATQMYDRATFALRAAGNAAVRDKSDSALMIELLSGGRIWYLSGDKLESLPGETLCGAAVDECREQRHLKELWERVLFNMLGTTGGGCDFLSTPNGMDYFYELDQRTQTNPNWGSFHAPSTSNPLWTPAMIEEARATMSDDLFAQEIMAEFREQGVGTCYTTFSSENITPISPFTGKDAISPYLPIVVGMDFNISPMCWLLGQHKQRRMHYHQEIYQERAPVGKSPTQAAAETLAEIAKNHAPGLILIGDASGKAGQRSAPEGQSDYDTIKQILKKNGIRYEDRTPDANPGIKDRVNTVNTALRSADGAISLTFHPNCKRAILDRRKRKWKDGGVNLAFDDSDGGGHMSDAGDYPVCVLMPIKPVGNTPKMFIINRT